MQVLCLEGCLFCSKFALCAAFLKCLIGKHIFHPLVNVAFCDGNLERLLNVAFYDENLERLLNVAFFDWKCIRLNLS